MLCVVKGQVIAQQMRGIFSKIPPSNRTTRSDTLGYQATNEKAPLQILFDEVEKLKQEAYWKGDVWFVMQTAGMTGPTPC